MSAARALRRFLGLAPDSDDRTLLGLPQAPAAISATHVRAALADRLLRIDRHPAREGHDAGVVRELVRAAAARLEREVGVAADAREAPGRPPAPGGTVGPDLAAKGTSAAPEARSSLRPVPPRGHPLARAGAAAPRPSAASPVRPDPRGPAPTAGRRALTPFDRMVLAVLVSCGGWNAASRARLVSLAAQRGVGVDGLMKVVSGLAEHVRTGGARPTSGDLHEGARMLTADRPPPEPSKLEAIVEQVAEAMGNELRSERWGPRLRVTVVFSILTLALLALLVRVMLVPAGGDEEKSAAPPGTIAATDGVRAPSATGPEGATAAPPTRAPQPVQPASFGAVVPAKFERPPTFAGERQSADSLRLAEQAVGLPALIETLGRRAIVAGEGVSPAVEREWIASLDEAGRSWPLLEPRLREAIVASFVEVLRGIDSPAVLDRLLAPLRASEPLRTGPALWSAAFRSGLLAELVSRASVLPPGLVAAANEALRQGLGAGAAGGREGDGEASGTTAAPAGDAAMAPATGFARGAGARLDTAVPFMVEQLAAEDLARRTKREQGEAPADERGQRGEYADLWEAWITAQRALRSGSELQRAYVAATSALLRSGIDLSATGPASDVLGRFVTPLLDFNDDLGVRAALLEWFGDQRIGSDALWVLTSMMLRNAGIAWFRSDLLIDWNFDRSRRLAIRDALAGRWPPPAPEESTRRPPIVVAADLLELWRTALRAVERGAAAATNASAAMRSLLMAATLNEAASAMEVGQEQRARDLVRDVQAASEPAASGAWPPRGVTAASPVGTPSGTDGEWARQHAEVERNLEQRLATLRQLRTRPGGDLGPRDAEVFVREVVRASPADARSVARAVLLESFKYGPNVLVELLDQLPDAGAGEELSQVIAELTERPLPPARAPDWMRQARLALLTHVLGLRRGADAEVDAIAASLGEVMRERITLLPRSTVEIPGSQASPQQSLARLVDAWRERAGSMVVARPTPAPLAELDRRRMLRQQVAFGAVASFVAEQIAHLELLAFVLSGEAPWLHAAIAQVVQEASELRARASSALAQALATELATARLWELALAGLDEAPSHEVEVPEGAMAPAGGNVPAPPGGTQDAPRAPAPSPGDGGAPRRPTEQAPVPPPGVEPPIKAPPPIRR